jgi:hypothetical protein
VTEELKRATWRYADDHADADGVVDTPIQGVRMMRVHAPIGPMRAMYKPVLCLVFKAPSR